MLQPTRVSRSKEAWSEKQPIQQALDGTDPILGVSITRTDQIPDDQLKGSEKSFFI